MESGEFEIEKVQNQTVTKEINYDEFIGPKAEKDVAPKDENVETQPTLLTGQTQEIGQHKP